MNFKSQICTSVEESKRLLELGLKKETADCGHFYVRQEHEEYEDWETIILDNNWQFDWDVTDKEIPAWSLHRLLEMLYADIGECIIFFPNTYEEIIGDIENLIRRRIFNKDYLEDKQ
jgi:hypothetical protein